MIHWVARLHHGICAYVIMEFQNKAVGKEMPLVAVLTVVMYLDIICNNDSCHMILMMIMMKIIVATPW